MPRISRLVGLSTPAHGAAERQEELVTTKHKSGSVVLWKSLGGARQMREFLESADFRIRFEELSAQADSRIIGLSPDLAPTKALNPIYTEGYSVILVAQHDATRLSDLERFARIIWSGGGEVAGVVLVDPGMMPVARAG